MSYKMPDRQTVFVFQVSSGGQPLARVERIGFGFWITCCPLCGCLHDVTRYERAKSAEMPPACRLPYTHPAAYRAWIERFPEAADFKRVALVWCREFEVSTRPGILECVA